MQLPTSLFSSVFLAVVLASTVSAVPLKDGEASTVSAVSLKDGVALRGGLADIADSYYRESSFRTYGLEGVPRPLSVADKEDAPFDLKSAALSVVQSRLNLPPNAVAYRTGYTKDVAQYAYLVQQIRGIRVANAVANVVFNNDNKVVAFGSSFVDVEPSDVPSPTPSVSVEEAIKKAEAAMDGSYNQHPVKLEYVVRRDGTLSLAHVVQIQDMTKAMWLEVYVDAHTGEIAQLTDFTARCSSYRVLLLRNQNLTDGFDTVNNPENILASPFGWHSASINQINIDTQGNNVQSFAGGSTSSQSTPLLNFIYIQDPTQQPNANSENVNAARVNAFYIVNKMHDISYIYGFDEVAANFQLNNFGKGGQGNDRVLLSVQDGSGRDDAAIHTPPDGQSPVIQLFLWDFTNPLRDGAFENDLIVHEYAHGMADRLTGGGSAQCLQNLESQGLAEGWSDAVAEWTEQTDINVIDWFFAPYVSNNPAGIRTHPYSTNTNTNPLRYSSLQNQQNIHIIGEVWANILHNIYAALIRKYSFSVDFDRDSTGLSGNVIFFHLIVDALAIEPCNPSFPQARDAMIQADANRYTGANFCLLWRVFASRGLGTRAANHNDDSSLPPNC